MRENKRKNTILFIDKTVEGLIGGSMNRKGIGVGIIGGIGLGILIGCEFCGSTMTIVGGILVLFAIVSMIYLKYKEG
jgi:hypothetical protein